MSPDAGLVAVVVVVGLKLVVAVAAVEQVGTLGAEQLVVAGLAVELRVVAALVVADDLRAVVTVAEANHDRRAQRRARAFDDRPASVGVLATVPDAQRVLDLGNVVERRGVSGRRCPSVR